MAAKIDFDGLDKGSVISVEQIEEHTGHKYGTTAYGLAAVGLQGQVDTHLQKQGVDASVKMDKGCLCVLTDEAAEPYQKSRFARGTRIMGKAKGKHDKIDVGQLSVEARHGHERDNVIMGQMIQGAMGAAGSQGLLRASAHQRMLPGLPTDGS